MSQTASNTRRSDDDEASIVIEERLRLIINTISTIVWRKLPDGSADFLNRNFREYTGLSLEDGLGWGWMMNAFHPDDRFLEEWRVLSQLHASIPSSSRKLRKLASECEELADRCIREVRTLSYLLHPPMLDEAGLEDAIRHYVDGFSERTRIDVKLQISPHFGRMPADVELALFRVIQESLTNIHA